MEVLADTCAKVYVDTTYRKLWDPYVRGMPRAICSHVLFAWSYKLLAGSR